MDWTRIKQAAARIEESHAAGPSGQAAQTGWRCLEELADTPEFRELLGREFAVPPDASDNAGIGRRDFLRLLGGTLGLAGVAGLAGCTVKPRGNIVPYVDQPEHLVPGRPVIYATALEFCGYGRGVLVETHEGRPTKVEGNPGHPASLGATSIFEQASILDLYNPVRSASVLKKGAINTWPAFLAELQTALLKLPPGGAGLHLLTGAMTSPAFGDQWQTLLRRYPAAQWHQYEPVHRDGAFEAAGAQNRGQSQAQYHFDRARVIVSFASDFLFALPGSVRYARDLMAGRDASKGQAALNRLYVVESVPTITGAYADERRAVRASGPGGIGAYAAALAAELGLSVTASGGQAVDSEAKAWAAQVAGDLKAARGASLLIAGEDQPAALHMLVSAMNAALGAFGGAGATITHTGPIGLNPVNQTASLKALVEAIHAGSAQILLMLGGDWAHTAPSDFEFAEAIRRVPLSVHSGLYRDETADTATWHIPQAHPLESWADTRAFDGTASIVQPMIEPLYGGRTLHEIFDCVVRFPGRRAYDIVRGYWVQPQRLSEEQWRRALHDGLIAGTAAPSVPAAPGSASPVSIDVGPLEADQGMLELLFAPDSGLWDGRFAKNAWLQELPRPITKLSWDNALLVGPSTAKRLELATGDIVELRARSGKPLRGAVMVQPGVADGTITLTLGGGSWPTHGENGFFATRDNAGANGVAREKIGIDAYPFRTSSEPWRRAVSLKKTGESQELVTTQQHHLVEGRDLLRAGTLAELASRYPGPDEAPPTLYNLTTTMTDGVAWAMVIDLTRCIGCNACMVACQSENNIPPVGRKEASRGRTMHWIRIDSYYFGDPGQPFIAHQPVPCMHCETAPCELVCPVEATLHDHEGLNLQVYNRCIGTRYCSNNCPYKVRRFNFFRYAEEAAREPLLLMENPNVTVRARGVMEKCTYCLQRISVARIRASLDDRPIRDGEVTPACAQACPTSTIVFGNRNDAESRVAKLKQSPLNYSLLNDQNTRPRTTYLAKVRNPFGVPS